MYFDKIDPISPLTPVERITGVQPVAGRKKKENRKEFIKSGFYEILIKVFAAEDKSEKIDKSRGNNLDITI